MIKICCNAFLKEVFAFVTDTNVPELPAGLKDWNREKQEKPVNEAAA